MSHLNRAVDAPRRRRALAGPRAQRRLGIYGLGTTCAQPHYHLQLTTLTPLYTLLLALGRAIPNRSGIRLQRACSMRAIRWAGALGALHALVGALHAHVARARPAAWQSSGGRCCCPASALPLQCCEREAAPAGLGLAGRTQSLWAHAVLSARSGKANGGACERGRAAGAARLWCWAASWRYSSCTATIPCSQWTVPATASKGGAIMM